MTADVVIVGGGPAGAATATRLARAGHRVVVVDRARFPRDKPCGECVNPAGVAALSALGALEPVLALPHADLRGWAVRRAEGDGFAGRFPAGERGIAVARRELDAALLRLAGDSGVEVRTGERVAELLREGGQVAGVRLANGTELRARLTVGADGLRSVVVRRLGLLRRAPRLRKLALTAHVRGLSLPPGEGALFLLPDGCVGVAETAAGECNVTVVLTGAAAREVAGGRESAFDVAIARIPALRGARRSGGVLATGPFDWPVRRAIADGALLVGDAAGYFDPFTGQGIFRALRGAELAAAAADAALRVGDLSAGALAPYEAARRRAFAPGERVQRVVEGFVSRPGLMRWVAAGFRARPQLADRLIAVTGDLLPVRSLLDPALLTGGAR